MMVILVACIPACCCRFYQDLSYEERSKMLKDRLKKYSQKVLSPIQAMLLLLPVPLSSSFDFDTTLLWKHQIL